MDNACEGEKVNTQSSSATWMIPDIFSLFLWFCYAWEMEEESKTNIAHAVWAMNTKSHWAMRVGTPSKRTGMPKNSSFGFQNGRQKKQNKTKTLNTPLSPLPAPPYFWINIWKELSVSSRLISILPQEMLFCFTYGNYGLAMLAKSIHEVWFTVTIPQNY